MTDPDTARWNTMRDLSNCARLLARAEENRPEEPSLTHVEFVGGVALLVCLTVAVWLGLSIAGVV